MTDFEKNGGNIFKTMDEIIFQLNRTKKMFIIMILTVMIIPPISFLIFMAIYDPPFESQENAERDGPKPKFTIFRVIPLIISVVWLGIGIRQWIVLSKWTKKYDRYKELQEKIDKKLVDEEKDDEKDSSN
jgi:NADH:ubiquinone oxidoreductase subunit 5 (subunit L)/multisubunit Na+/H+ antiporter MnhA subunit